jgi:hypothetical protein
MRFEINYYSYLLNIYMAMEMLLDQNTLGMNRSMVPIHNMVEFVYMYLFFFVFLNIFKSLTSSRVHTMTMHIKL